MAVIRPFLFERAFADETSASSASQQAEPAPVFTLDDIERARSEGLAEGRSQGRALAEADSTHRLALATEKLVVLMRDLLTRTAERDTHVLREGVAVATAIGRKVLPHLYALQGSSEVDRIVAQILPKVLEEGPIVIRVPSALVAELSPLLLGTAAKQGIADGLRIVGDDDLPAGDCRVEWPGGGAVRSAEQLWREIDQVIEDQLSSAGFLGFTGSAIQSDSLKV